MLQLILIHQSNTNQFYFKKTSFTAVRAEESGGFESFNCNAHSLVTKKLGN